MPTNYQMRFMLLLLISIIAFLVIGCRQSSPPAVTDISIHPDAQISVGEEATLSIEASGSNLKFKWTADKGSITGEGSSVVYKAPNKPGLDSVTVVVEDDGSTVVKNLTIQAVQVVAIATPTHTPIPTDTPAPLIPTDTPVFTKSSEAIQLIYENDLTDGYDLGVDDGGKNRRWYGVEGGNMRMEYPGGLDWGVVFITVGPPTESYPRAGQDFSNYSKLVIEMRGEVGNEKVEVGIKDNMDPDNGKETKMPVLGLTREWQPFEFSLSEFTTADLANIYVVAEFVFGNEPATVYVRKIQYLQ